MRLPIALLTAALVTFTGYPSQCHAEVQKLSDVIGEKISVTNGDGMKLADLVIDQESERIAYVSFTRLNAKATVVVPAQDLRYKGSELSYEGKADGLSDAPKTPKREQLSAKRMAKVDKHFGHDPYWKQDRKSGNPIEPRLRMGRSLLNVEVVDGDKMPLGEVVDVGLDLGKWKVLYVVIRDTKDQMHAVPLAAFEKSDDASVFVLKVPQDVFFNGSTFAAEDAWPEMVDRQWIEYVQVRYGRKGVQAAGAADENNPQKQ